MMKRTIPHALVAVLLVCTAVSTAAPASAQEEAPDVIHDRTLSNGLDVLVLPSPSVPIVTVEITVKNGAYTEPSEFNGLSHLYEHMFFKGNAVIPNQEAYLRRMRQLGIVFNGTTSTERVNYYFTLPSDNLEKGLVFMFNAITSPKFDSTEFEKEKKVVLGEVDRNESSPYYWFDRAIKEKLWYAHPTRKDPLGDRATIETATVDKMRRMKDRYYHPNNSVLVIAGDVEPEEGFQLAEKVFADWQRGTDPFARWPIPEHPPLKQNEFVVVQKDVEVPVVQFSWHGPSVDDDPKSTFAADVLSYILSQPTSKFQKNLVESGITLNASMSYYTQKYTGPISVQAQVEPDKLEQAIPTILEELEKIALPGYFSDDELENAKTILAVEDLYDREKLSSFAHTVSFWWAVAGLDYYRNYIANLKAVTRADINRYVSRYVVGKPLVAGALLSPTQKKEIGFDESKLRGLVNRAAATVSNQ